LAEIGFYHLTKTALEPALGQLLTKVLESGKRAVVMVGSVERVEHLNAHLWTYNDRGFLPHGSRTDGAAELQPIWLTDSDENPNGATVLFLADGAVSGAVGDYDLVCTLFDGRDPDAVAQARAQWRDYGAGGHDLTYWQQTDAGGWQQKTEG